MLLFCCQDSVPVLITAATSMRTVALGKENQKRVEHRID